MTIKPSTDKGWLYRLGETLKHNADYQIGVILGLGIIVLLITRLFS